MENEITYIPMDDDFHREIMERYTKPFREQMTLMGIVCVICYVIALAAISQKDYSNRIPENHFGRPSAPHSATELFFWTTGIVIAVFWFTLVKARRSKRHYKEDADFGYIAKERVHISSVYPTPAGINIYWLDSESILSFTPDPYRHFSVGDPVTIYYLENSKEYLAYDFS